MTADQVTTQEGKAKFRILLVDDNKDVADSLAVLLGLLGYQVKVVYGSLEALRAARTFKPACIISDIGMPVMDGYRLATELRQDESFKEVTLIALSAYEDVARAKAAGFDHHLTKPASPEMIEELLMKAIDMAAELERTKEAVQQQGAVVEEVKELIKEVRADVKELKNGLQQDVKGIKEELRELKNDKNG